MSVIFDPINIGTVELKNRIVFPPMSTGYEDNGKITEKAQNFYSTVAAGGASLIILGDVAIQPCFAPIPSAHDDIFIPGLQNLVADVHEKGAKIAAQLFHQEYDAVEMGALLKSKGPEAAREKMHEDMRHYSNRLSKEDISVIIDRFAAAARRVKAAGFDIIHLHGDRLNGMFCSPLINQRTDEYGGSLENRARFTLEVVRKIREVVPDMALEYKMAVIRTDPPMGKGGPTVEEAKQMAEWLVETGVDSFHVALANHDSIANTIPGSGTQPYGCFVDLAREIKSVVDVPVTAVGRILFPDQAEKILSENKADLIGIGRGLIADPQWISKYRENRKDSIRYCIMCNHCVDGLMKRRHVTCAINAEVGGDQPAIPSKTQSKKKVLVIGGGAAGMEAARICAKTGHDVVLCEQTDQLGGQINIASVAPYKTEMKRIVNYLSGQMKEKGVDTRLATPFRADLLDTIKPDVVIIASGASSKLMESLPEGPIDVVDAWDVLSGDATVGQNVMVFGGGAVGAETAMYLADRGHAVSIAFRSDVSLIDKITEEKSITLIPAVARFIEEKNIQSYPGVTPSTIKEKLINLTDQNGKTFEVTADTIVSATGIQRNETFEEELGKRNIPFHVIGDCAIDSKGLLADAILSAFNVAIEI